MKRYMFWDMEGTVADLERLKRSLEHPVASPVARPGHRTAAPPPP